MVHIQMKHHDKIAAAFSVNAKFLPFFAHLYFYPNPQFGNLTLKSSYPPHFCQKLISPATPVFLFAFKMSLFV